MRNSCSSRSSVRSRWSSDAATHERRRAASRASRDRVRMRHSPASPRSSRSEARARRGAREASVTPARRAARPAARRRRRATRAVGARRAARTRAVGARPDRARASPLGDARCASAACPRRLWSTRLSSVSATRCRRRRPSRPARRAIPTRERQRQPQRGSAAGSRRVLPQPVADAAHGLDRRRAERPVDLLAQVAHVDVDDVRAALVADVPGALEQLRRARAPGPAGA